MGCVVVFQDCPRGEAGNETDIEYVPNLLLHVLTADVIEHLDDEDRITTVETLESGSCFTPFDIHGGYDPVLARHFADAVIRLEASRLVPGVASQPVNPAFWDSLLALKARLNEWPSGDVEDETPVG